MRNNFKLEELLQQSLNPEYNCSLRSLLLVKNNMKQNLKIKNIIFSVLATRLFRYIDAMHVKKIEAVR